MKRPSILLLALSGVFLANLELAAAPRKKTARSASTSRSSSRAGKTRRAAKVSAAAPAENDSLAKDVGELRKQINILKAEAAKTADIDAIRKEVADLKTLPQQDAPKISAKCPPNRAYTPQEAFTCIGRPDKSKWTLLATQTQETWARLRPELGQTGKIEPGIYRVDTSWDPARTISQVFAIYEPMNYVLFGDNFYFSNDPLATFPQINPNAVYYSSSWSGDIKMWTPGITVGDVGGKSTYGALYKLND
jgi:hypothetical protein